MRVIKLYKKIFSKITRIGTKPDDDESTRLQKKTFLSISFMISFFAVGWGVYYIILNEPLSGSIPLFYSFFSFISLGILAKSLNFRFFRFSQLLLILFCPFILMLTLGGFVNGSTVILWALFAPLGALLSGLQRQAIYWFLVYVVFVIISGFAHPYLRMENNLPPQTIIFFFVMNVITISSLAFFSLNYFVGKKDIAMNLLRKNRELEQAYLQQEIMLRQSEKLATLGRLSAGVAHEINNPAGATERSAKQLENAFIKMEQNEFELGQSNLSKEHFEILKQHTQQIHQHIKHPINFDPIMRSEKEDEIEHWLRDREINDTWEFAPTLINMGYNVAELATLAKFFTTDQFPIIIAFLCNIYITRNLIGEIGHGTNRITEIVKALKSYSYLDKAPLQSVDIHEGLNDTLVILRSKLTAGIKVNLEYAKDIPRIEAYGNELNQVWTNILDNAISAMQGTGEIVIRTRVQNPWIIVEIEDDGPGIPQDIQSKIYDPFFTTKAPGEGTGLGLNISYNIIVEKHKGTIEVHSKPGRTHFEVKVPLNFKHSNQES
jgi:signal transduction histidine kinase